jgi:putative endonuclease
MFVVYAIYNKKHNKFYIGQTRDIDRRVRFHNDQIFRSSYTSRFDGDWQIIYQEELPDRSSAIRREKQLKSYRGREFIKMHIPV